MNKVTGASVNFPVTEKSQSVKVYATNWSASLKNSSNNIIVASSWEIFEYGMEAKANHYEIISTVFSLQSTLYPS
jgi:hypothetical protein